MLALQLQNADASLLSSFNDDQWRELLPMMDRARLTLAFAQQLHSGIPCWVQERLSSNLAHTAQNWERVRSAYREAAATLDAKGVDYLVLKGFTQTPDFVPEGELRWQSDIDFYVPPDQIASAVAALREIGYVPYSPGEPNQYADHVPTMLRFGTWQWRCDWYDPETPPAIEVHFCFWNEPVSSIAIPEFDEFWKRRRVRASHELIFPALQHLDHLAYFAMHILRDIFNEDIRPNRLRELGTFLDGHASGDAFWKEWTTAYSPRLRSMQAVAFALAGAWFSCNISDTVLSEIDSLPTLVRVWIERCGCTPLEAQFRRSRNGRLLQRLFAETPEARRKILWRALVPDRIPGPAKVASRETHASLPALPKRISRFLDYPLYIVSRAWMNGGAVARFLAHACLMYFLRGREFPVSRSDFGGALGR